jgi:D-alanyl-D-alanine carboxypeptidase
MFEKLSDPSITGGKILGGKTGYTDEAGLCLASLAKEGKQEYILVTAGEHISRLGCIGEQQAKLATSLVETFG